MKVKCLECGGEVNVTDDALRGELTSCPDCGQEYEVEIVLGRVKLKFAERVREDWGE